MDHNGSATRTDLKARAAAEAQGFADGIATGIELAAEFAERSGLHGFAADLRNARIGERVGNGKSR